MCGRYFIEISDSELADIVAAVQQKLAGETVQQGEIFPTNLVPALHSVGGAVTPVAAYWGFPMYGGKKGVIINAKAETVEEKPTFRQSFAESRCLLPASGFYEWSQSSTPKQKYLFQVPGEHVLYLAGIIKQTDDAQRFVVLTTEANASIADIHARMPVIVTRQQLMPWLNDLDAARAIIRRPMPELSRAAC